MYGFRDLEPTTKRKRIPYLPQKKEKNKKTRERGSGKEGVGGEIA